MNTRKATLDDVTALYELGKRTPELRVSATEEFMAHDEFQACITQKEGVFLVAEEQGVQGFVFASTKDADRPLSNKYACLVYIAVAPDARGKGVAKRLYDACVTELKAAGVTHLYTWANPESGVIDFFKKQGLSEGHPCVWMDKAL